MKTYTLGFIFNPSFEKVLLVHKQRPEWQKGRMNGIGGKLEEGEESLACIVREVQEEANLDTKPEAWVRLGDMRSSDWIVDLYALVYQGDLRDAVSPTDEMVEWFEVLYLPANVISNISWFVPLAIDKLKNNEFETFSIYYPI